MKHILLTIIFSVAFTLIGCSSGTKITGTVKFSDGSPVSFGYVAFDNGKYCFVGAIKADGAYSTGLVGGKKIPIGVYKVYLQGMVETKEVFGGPNGEYILSSETIYHVAPKYCLPDTSGLTFTVDGKTKAFDIKVERYAATARK
ncbi:MAG: hypothetical protein LBJ67_06455 [Planctomycetaceae bacterium]|jgi:hypothetical protein|nr:hypothetical protein [Planctomycetaceae bacterium]